MSLPSTLLSLVEAWLPVMFGLSTMAVPKVAMPPPTPTLDRPVTPAWPGMAEPVLAEGGSSASGGGAAPGPPARPIRPAPDWS